MRKEDRDLMLSSIDAAIDKALQDLGMAPVGIRKVLPGYSWFISVSSFFPMLREEYAAVVQSMPSVEWLRLYGGKGYRYYLLASSLARAVRFPTNEAEVHISAALRKPERERLGAASARYREASADTLLAVPGIVYYSHEQGIIAHCPPKYSLSSEELAAMQREGDARLAAMKQEQEKRRQEKLQRENERMERKRSQSAAPGKKELGKKELGKKELGRKEGEVPSSIVQPPSIVHGEEPFPSYSAFEKALQDLCAAPVWPVGENFTRGMPVVPAVDLPISADEAHELLADPATTYLFFKDRERASLPEWLYIPLSALGQYQNENGKSPLSSRIKSWLASKAGKPALSFGRAARRYSRHPDSASPLRAYAATGHGSVYHAFILGMHHMDQDRYANVANGLMQVEAYLDGARTADNRKISQENRDGFLHYIAKQGIRPFVWHGRGYFTSQDILALQREGIMPPSDRGGIDMTTLIGRQGNQD